MTLCFKKMVAHSEGTTGLQRYWGMLRPQPLQICFGDQSRIVAMRGVGAKMK